YVEIGGAKGFIKPYEGGEIAFVGLETPEGMTVDEFVQSLSGDDFINGFKNSSKEYEVSTRMPQFKYDYGTSLVDALRSLGINSAFIGGLADFTGMTPPDQPVNISDVIHKTHIELDKNGTKAAAVTAVVFEKSSLIPDDKRKNVKLDHPFVYAIIDNESGIPLFIGTVKTLG
ncbi:MAG: proteinase inhibitor I4 serpin, partial [Lachnospiraceae bacterium]|nr:proteinase inhibitor I4 serpin [Lachnospiraceae bacterium]